MITKIEEEYMGKIETINCINKPKVATGSFTSCRGFGPTGFCLL